MTTQHIQHFVLDNCDESIQDRQIQLHRLFGPGYNVMGTKREAGRFVRRVWVSVETRRGWYQENAIPVEKHIDEGQHIVRADGWKEARLLLEKSSEDFRNS